MTSPFMTMRSTVPSRFLKVRLLRGTLVSLVGIAVMMILALYRPEELGLLGLLSFLVAICLIGSGLLPYKKLAMKAQYPDALHFFESGRLLYIQGKHSTLISLEAIEKIRFIATPSLFGIAIYYGASHFRPRALSAAPDLFLPFFSERSFDEWLEWRETG